MIPLKVPCRSDCPHRTAEPNCHSELCPFGWNEFEKSREDYRNDIHRQKEPRVQTAGKRAKTIQQLARVKKQGRRY